MVATVVALRRHAGLYRSRRAVGGGGELAGRCEGLPASPRPDGRRDVRAALRADRCFSATASRWSCSAPASSPRRLQARAAAVASLFARRAARRSAARVASSGRGPCRWAVSRLSRCSARPATSVRAEPLLLFCSEPGGAEPHRTARSFDCCSSAIALGVWRQPESQRRHLPLSRLGARLEGSTGPVASAAAGATAVLVAALPYALIPRTSRSPGHLTWLQGRRRSRPAGSGRCRPRSNG